MSEHSNISWTDATWNPVVGCDKVSLGCNGCYAIRDGWRLAHNPNPKVRQIYEGLVQKLNDRLNWTGVVRTVPDRLEQPLHWKKPLKIFVNSQSDLFHDAVPEEFISRVFSVMAAADWHQFQVLTKRPLRMYRYIESHKRTLSLMSEVWPIPNIWLGCSVENQQTADERIPLLLQTPAAVRFVSAEPLLEPIRFARVPGFNLAGSRGQDLLRNFWVITGGESGPKSRPCNAGWIRSIVAQCRVAGVPVFVKQTGSYVVDRNDAGWWGEEETHWPLNADGSDREFDEIETGYQGAPVRVRLKDRKGGDPLEWPMDLRIREMPQ